MFTCMIEPEWKLFFSIELRKNTRTKKEKISEKKNYD